MHARNPRPLFTQRECYERSIRATARRDDYAYLF